MASELLGPSWNISPVGLDLLTVKNTIRDKSTILKKALDTDLKEIGSPILAKLSKNIKEVVLQIQKIRNISAPKANENSQAAPRMLKLILTDGETYIQAIETDPITTINRDKTPPGSKLLIKNAKISSGYLLLDSNNCTLLGGKVPALYEKWEIAKSVEYYNRKNTGTDGAPAWVNFGGKIQAIQLPEKPLEKQDLESKENTKFELLRQDLIAEAATTGAVKKVFGGTVKLPVQIIKKPEYQPREKKNFRNKIDNFDPDIEDKPSKPSERVSLFDFLEDKLPASDSKPSANKNSFHNNNYANPTNDPFPEYNARNYDNHKAHRPEGKFNNYDRPQTGYGGDFNRGARNGSNQGRGNFNQGRSDFNRGKKDFNQGRNDFNQSRNDFNQGRNDFNQSRNDFNQGRNDFNQGKNEFNQGKRDFKPRKDFNQGGNDFNQAKNDFHQSKTDFNQSKTDFHQGKADFNQGRRDFNRGQSADFNKGPRNDSNRPPRREFDRPTRDDTNRGPRPPTAPLKTDVSHNGHPKSAVSHNGAVPQSNNVVNDLSRSLGNMSVNSQFAKNSLKQHLNLEKRKEVENPNSWKWSIGDDCMAKYWEDGKYYNANVSAVTDTTCVVKFQGYGNTEEVLKVDCLPVSREEAPKPQQKDFKKSKTFSRKQ